MEFIDFQSNKSEKDMAENMNFDQLNDEGFNMMNDVYESSLSDYNQTNDQYQEGGINNQHEENNANNTVIQYQEKSQKKNKLNHTAVARWQVALISPDGQIINVKDIAENSKRQITEQKEAFLEKISDILKALKAIKEYKKQELERNRAKFMKIKQQFGI